MGRWGDFGDLDYCSLFPDPLFPTPYSRLPTPYSLSSIMINKPKDNYQYHAGLVSSLGNF
ncbi:MAG: hypothetical protein F6J94_10230 [Moorea sp. SIO1F2]|uniref:hypothetical protein n=1 Tax=Moorena sp. SIO1F2 TaxID=2607819 RepID=UPI0013BB72AE|nr:hypothetical protein [Moorena sp. SIO1F2]NET82299.1 hypothetical protein [Moorena sp. SIO1F2]